MKMYIQEGYILCCYDEAPFAAYNVFMQFQSLHENCDHGTHSVSSVELEFGPLGEPCTESNSTHISLRFVRSSVTHVQFRESLDTPFPTQPTFQLTERSARGQCP